MARKKTTVYIDEDVLRAAKVAAATQGRREYEVFEEALRDWLGIGGVMERIRSKIPTNDTLDEEEASQVAAEELAAMRAERRTSRRAG